MKLLNVGCGGHRPGPPWTNLDTLREFLKEGTPERTNLDAEPNYIECNLLLQSIPEKDKTFDGILLQHVLEHFTCHQAVDVLLSCKRVLKDGGVLVASVPDVAYFREMNPDDNRENAMSIFGESISGDWHDAKCETFFDYALFHREHKQILNEDGLWALLRRAGFHDELIRKGPDILIPLELYGEIGRQLNRQKFSTILWAIR